MASPQDFNLSQQATPCYLDSVSTASTLEGEDVVDTLPEWLRLIADTPMHEDEEVHRPQGSDPYVLNYLDGNVYHPSLQSNKTLIISVHNCTSVRDTQLGFNTQLHKAYPHSNPYSKRRPLYSSSRCRVSDRPSPGTIEISTSPSPSHPTTISLYGQYAPGAMLEKNTLNQKYLASSQDVHFVEGLGKDYHSHRVQYFERAITQVKFWVFSHREVNKVVVPYKAGIPGLPYLAWKNEYLPILNQFSSDLRRISVRVFVLDKWWSSGAVEPKTSMENNKSSSQQPSDDPYDKTLKISCPALEVPSFSAPTEIRLSQC